MNNSIDYTDWPEWVTEEAYKTIKKNFLKDNETPSDLYARLASTAVYFNNELDVGDLIHVLSKSWIGPATPVAANFGRASGFPVSCFGLQPGNTIKDIFQNATTQALISKNGGGVSIDVSNLIGPTEVTRWAKNYDHAASVVSQTGAEKGEIRKGAVAVYLDAHHPDALAFLRAKDLNDGGDYRKKLDCNIALILDDVFMDSVLSGDAKSNEIFRLALKTRMQTGSPYLWFTDNAKNADPECYKVRDLSTKYSNLCSEIALHSDPQTGFTCVLSSLNLAKYDEWKNWVDSKGRSLPQLATLFLDTVCEEFIRKASATAYVDDLQPLIKGAIKGRPLGLGVMGFHTLLQQRSISFGSMAARRLNREIFSWIQVETKKGSQELASDLGSPEWCKGTGLRNTHRTAIAPTLTNSVIVGGVSPGIEPVFSNSYTFVGTNGSYVRRNPVFQALMDANNYDPEFQQAAWASIEDNDGSVQQLNWLSDSEKDVFKTAYEIDQSDIIQLAAERQPFICQGQSVNLFIPPETPAIDIAKYHIDAWLKGLKGLYYLRSKAESVAPVTASEDGIKLCSLEAQTEDCGCDG